jgi:hypothetical protein
MLHHSRRSVQGPGHAIQHFRPLRLCPSATRPTHSTYQFCPAVFPSSNNFHELIALYPCNQQVLYEYFFCIHTLHYPSRRQKPASVTYLRHLLSRVAPKRKRKKAKLPLPCPCLPTSIVPVSTALGSCSEVRYLTLPCLRHGPTT